MNMSAIYLLIGIVVVLAVVIGVMYNSLVRKKVQCNESWSGIEVQMKRRYDLIPNLVNSFFAKQGA